MRLPHLYAEVFGGYVNVGEAHRGAADGPADAFEGRNAAMRIKIEAAERSGWWHVKVCGPRHSRYRSQAAARHGAKRLAARVQKLSMQARTRTGRMQLGQRLRVAHCELYCIRTLLRGRR